MTALLSLVELPAEFGVDPDEALAVARRRPAELPVWIDAPGWKYTFFTESKIGIDSEGRELWARSNRLAAVLHRPQLLHPHFLVGFRDEVIITHGAGGLAPLPPDREEAVTIWEFDPPLRIARGDLLFRRVDVERWIHATEARRGGGGRGDELKLALAAALDGSPRFELSTQEAADVLGVAYNTLRARKKASEGLAIPPVWLSINPAAKRETFRWLSNHVGLMAWAELLALLSSATVKTLDKTKAKRPRRASARRAPSRSGGAARMTDDEALLEALLKRKH